MGSVANILGQDAFWIINKRLAKEIGLEASLLLSDLLTKSQYFDEEWFFNTAENIQKDTGLTYHKQKAAIKILKEQEFIDTKLIGIPAKQHFKILTNKIVNFLRTCYEKNQKLYNKNKPINNKVIIDAKPKVLEKKKSTYTLLKTFFEETFLAMTGNEYYFTAKDGAKIKSLIKKINHAYKSKDIDPSDEQVLNGFKHIISIAKEDNWIKDNFTLAIIDSQFNKLKIKKHDKNIGSQLKSILEDQEWLNS